MSAPTTTLSIPEFDDDVDMLSAALAYAECGWYVLPVRRGTKNPGSVVGDHWQHQSSRDPKVITGWFAASDYELVLHCGRSGAVVLDVDRPELVPDDWWQHLNSAPYQSTRSDRRGHYVFMQPPGRTIGCPVFPWGEVRGKNGVIKVFPSSHSDGGEYRWERT